MKKSRTAPFLGGFKLFWCDSCNIPILDKTPCYNCGNATRFVNIAPPGDVRPAFPDDVMRISKIIDSLYGSGSAQSLGLSNERIVLLNEVSYDDLMDEIIVDGVVIGALRYNLVLETSPLVYNSTQMYNITFQGRPPNKPLKPIGLPVGLSNRLNFFLTTARDLDGDEFWVKIQYNRDEYSQWIGPYESFHPMLFHKMWSIPSIYSMRIIAKDNYGMLSPWSEIKIVNIL